MLLRKAEPEEIEQIAAIDVKSFTESGFGRAHNMENDADFRKERHDLILDLCCKHPDWTYVAVEDDQIVGCGMIEYDAEKQTGSIDNNAVLPEYRNRGISTRLMEYLVEELKQLGARFINVHTVHVPEACRVYEKAGFTLTKQVQERDSMGGPPGLGSYYEMRI